jgi:hypothetical protein
MPDCRTCAHLVFGSGGRETHILSDDYDTIGRCEEPISSKPNLPIQHDCGHYQQSDVAALRAQMAEHQGRRDWHAENIQWLKRKIRGLE